MSTEQKGHEDICNDAQYALYFPTATYTDTPADGEGQNGHSAASTVDMIANGADTTGHVTLPDGGVIPPYVIKVGALVRHVDNGCRGIIRYIGPMYRRASTSSSSGDEVSVTTAASNYVRAAFLSGKGESNDASATSPVPSFTISGDPQQVWFGIEWETNCGKNDGSIEGIRYFYPSAPAPKSPPTRKPLFCCSMVRRTKFRIQKSLVRAMYNRYSLDQSTATSRTKTSGLDPFYRSPEGSFPNVHFCDCTANDSLQCIGYAHVGIQHNNADKQSPAEAGSSHPAKPAVTMRHVLSHRSLPGDFSDDGSVSSPLGGGEGFAANTGSLTATKTATPIHQNNLLTFPPAVGAGCTAMPTSPANSNANFPLFDTVFYTKGGSSNFTLSFLFPNLHTLSITGSLLQSWAELWEIIMSLPSLRELNASNVPLKNFTVSELQERWWFHKDRVRGTEGELVAGWRGSKNTSTQNSPHKNPTTEVFNSNDSVAAHKTMRSPSGRLPPLNNLNISDTNTSAETLLFVLAVLPTIKTLAVGHNPPQALLSGFKKCAIGLSTEPAAQHQAQNTMDSQNYVSLLHPLRMREAAERMMCSEEDWSYLKNFETNPGSPAAAPYLPAFSQIVVDAAETILYSIETLSVNKLDFSGCHDVSKILSTSRAEGPNRASSFVLKDSSLTPLLQSLLIVAKLADGVRKVSEEATKNGGPQPHHETYPKHTALKHLTVSKCPITSLGYDRYTELIDGAGWVDPLYLRCQKGLSFGFLDTQTSLTPNEAHNDTFLMAARGVLDRVHSLVARGCPSMKNWDVALNALQRTALTSATRASTPSHLLDAKHISFPMLDCLSISDAPVLAELGVDPAVVRKAALCAIPLRVTKLNMSDINLLERSGAERYALREFGAGYTERVIKPFLELLTKHLKKHEEDALKAGDASVSTASRKAIANSISGELLPKIRSGSIHHHHHHHALGTSPPKSSRPSSADTSGLTSPTSHIDVDAGVGRVVLELEKAAASESGNFVPKFDPSTDDDSDKASSTSEKDRQALSQCSSTSTNNELSAVGPTTIEQHQQGINHLSVPGGRAVVPQVGARFLRRLLSEAIDDLLANWGTEDDEEAPAAVITSPPKIVTPQYMKYSLRIEFTTILLPALELIAQRCGCFSEAVMGHVKRMNERAAKRKGESANIGSVVPAVGEQRKGMDTMFETAVDIRWTVSDLRRHLSIIAHLPEGDPYVQLQKEREQKRKSGAAFNEFHEVYNEEEHWSLCKMVFQTTMGLSSTPAYSSEYKSSRDKSESEHPLTVSARQLLNKAKADAAKAPNKLHASDNPAGFRFPPIQTLFPKDSLFLFHIDRELLENEGAVAKGMHCRELLRGQDTLHGCRINDGDLIVIVLVV